MLLEGKEADLKVQHNEQILFHKNHLISLIYFNRKCTSFTEDKESSWYDGVTGGVIVVKLGANLIFMKADRKQSGARIKDYSKLAERFQT